MDRLTRPSTIEFAAENGIGALSFAANKGPEDCRAQVENYYSIFAERAVPIAQAPNPNTLYTCGNLMCAPTHEQALERLGLSGGFFGWAIGYYYVTGQHHPGRDVLWSRYQQAMRGEVPPLEAATKPPEERGTREDWMRLAKEAYDKEVSRPGIGTPESILERVLEYEAAGVDELLFLLPPVRHEYIMESLELLGEHVLPVLRERDEKLSKEKEKRVAPMIEAAMARKVDDAPPLDPDYSFGGVPLSWDKTRAASEIAESRLGLSEEAIRQSLLEKAT